MNDGGTTADPGEAAALVLAAELARGDDVIANARPILRHLLVNNDHGLFNDEIVANLRGMLGHVSRQLLIAQAEAAGLADSDEYANAREDELAAVLYEDPAFLSFAHSQALESQLAARLMQRSAIDPVLAPLVQELIASPNPAIAQLAMAFLAAQARYMQQQKRMELPLNELPGDLLHRALVMLMSHPGEREDAAEQAAAMLRRNFEEGRSRLGLISRLVMAMGPQAARALSIDHAGLAVFATALSMATDQDRELAILSLGDRQSARLVLALRSAGLNRAAVEGQLLFFQPDAELPEWIDFLHADRAAAILSSTTRPASAY